MKNSEDKFPASVVLMSYTTRPTQGWAFAESVTPRTIKVQGWNFACSDSQQKKYPPCSNTLSKIRQHVGTP